MPRQPVYAHGTRSSRRFAVLRTVAADAVLRPLTPRFFINASCGGALQLLPSERHAACARTRRRPNVERTKGERRHVAPWMGSRITNSQRQSHLAVVRSLDRVRFVHCLLSKYGRSTADRTPYASADFPQNGRLRDDDVLLSLLWLTSPHVVAVGTIKRRRRLSRDLFDSITH